MNLATEVASLQSQPNRMGDYQTATQQIRSIQIQRADEPCFGTTKRYTCTEVCEWGKECRKLVAQWKR
ncbi:MAG: hypothetical protein WC426_09010 [Sulfuriferula sp.]